MRRPRLARLVPVLALLAWGATSLAAPTVEARWTYHVTVAPDLGSLTVRLAFERFTPRRVWLADGRTPTHVEILDEGGFPLAPDATTPGAFRVGEGGRPALDYRVDLRALLASGGAQRVGDDLLVHACAWMMRPALVPPGLRASVVFVCPEGITVAAPWRQLAAGPTFEVPSTSWEFIGHVALGRPRTQRFVAAGATVDLVRLDGPLTVPPEGLARWVGGAVAADASPYEGRFPASRLTVFVVPSPRARAPVPFGSAWYGGGPHVVLYVSPRATEADLTADWTAVHEIFHATMPPIAREDAWFSEGVTTYYQEVLRARAGLQTPLEAWNELESGFRRGRADGNGLPLAQESREMYANHAFHRVYWAGAALALLLDVETRRESGGARSLDDAMGWIREIPGGLERALGAEEAIAAIDARLGAPRFRRLAETWLARSEFPDLEVAQAWLGLVRGEDGRLSMAPAPGAPVRDAIMAR